MDLVQAADSLSALTVIPSYVILALTFVYGYLRPREYTEWLVVSSNTYLVIMAVMVFVSAFCFGLGLFLPDILASMGIGTELYLLILGVPSVIIYLFVFLSMVKSRMKIAGGTWQVSFVLFVFSMAQEGITLVKASTPSGNLLDIDVFSLPGFWLMLWYVAGAFVVLIGGSLIGGWIDDRFASLSEKHVPTMKERFGPKAPYELRFLDGSGAKGDYRAGFCMASGVVYCVWMILRHLILP